MRKLRLRPSPAVAIATVALFASLTGAAVGLPGKNTVDSGDLKKNSVQTSDIKDQGVGSADIKNGEVTSGDVADNGLTGADVDESTLSLGTFSAQIDDQVAKCSLARQVPASAGITSSDPNGATAGQCDVTFGRNVTACVYQVSLGRPTTVGAVNGEIAVEPKSGDANTLRVYSFNSTGAVADRPFGITAYC